MAFCYLASLSCSSETNEVCNGSHTQNLNFFLNCTKAYLCRVKGIFDVPKKMTNEQVLLCRSYTNENTLETFLIFVLTFISL